MIYLEFLLEIAMKARIFVTGASKMGVRVS